MVNSYGESADVNCPTCGHGFVAEVWLIVDAVERPDLVDRMRDGSLHDIACPGCGTPVGRVDAPLLLYTPEGNGSGDAARNDSAPTRPPVLFSPAEQTTAEQDQEQAAGLVARLRASLDAAWQDAWLAEGLPGVARPTLPAALSSDPQAALAAMAEQMQAEVERLRAEDPEAYRQLEAAARQPAQAAEAGADAGADRAVEASGEDDELPPAVSAALDAVIEELEGAGVIVDSAEALQAALTDRPDLQARLKAAVREAAEANAQ